MRERRRFAPYVVVVVAGGGGVRFFGLYFCMGIVYTSQHSPFVCKVLYLCCVLVPKQTWSRAQTEKSHVHAVMRWDAQHMMMLVNAMLHPHRVVDVVAVVSTRVHTDAHFVCADISSRCIIAYLLTERTHTHIQTHSHGRLKCYCAI